jgi:putative SOS response-associated peptidase YedK
MPVIVREEKNELIMMKWGLVPHRTQDIQTAKRPINARAETLSKKPSFHELLKNRRCLVPASGFFEWKREGKRKVPFYFHLPENPLFAFAGLYDQWTGPDGNCLCTYTVITTEPNELAAKIHNRMPSVLLPGHEDRWLSKTLLNTGDLKELLAPFPAENMEVYPVSPLVNTPDADDERIIRPLNSLTNTLIMD